MRASKQANIEPFRNYLQSLYLCRAPCATHQAGALVWIMPPKAICVRHPRGWFF